MEFPAIYATRRRLASLLRAGVNLVFPPRCLACQEAVGQNGTLCAACWPRLRWLRAPHCARCGLPFAHTLGEGALCAGCLSAPSPVDRWRAALAYEGPVAELIGRFKYQDGTMLAPVLAEWMRQAGAELFDGADLLLPVPLHWRRLLGRRYNQAGLLASRLGALVGLPVRMDLLRRTRHTTPQARMSRAARRRNVRGLFAVPKQRKQALAGRCVVLIDDVHTTGSTLEACARVLKRAGAKEVRCLTLARTLNETMQGV